MKKRIRKTLAFLFAMLLSFGCLAPAQQTYAANIITYNKTIQDSHGVKSSIYQVDNIYAWCCEAMRTTPVKNMTVTISESTSLNLRKVLWYGCKGPGAILNDDNDGYVQTAQAASLALGNGTVNSRYNAWYQKVITYAAPPSGFKAYIATPTNSNYQKLAFFIYTPTGSAYLQKKSSDTAVLGNTNYSLNNAVYGVYSNYACTTQVATFTTDSNGKSNTITLDESTYYVKEKTAPKGYGLDSTIYELKVKSGETVSLSVTDKPVMGTLQIVKKSAITEITNDNSCYSLEGAKFSVYKDANKTQLVDTLVTDSNGNTKSISLALGTYYVEETVTPKGYAKCADFTVTVTNSDKITKEVTELPQSDPVGIILKKVDYSTGESTAVAGASLEGAEYTVKYYDGFYNTDPAASNISAKKVWVLKTDTDGYAYLHADSFVSGDSFYYNSMGDVTLPLGTITIQETKAPIGYLINDEIYIRKITEEGVTESINTYNAPTTPEMVKRGDIEFTKVDDKSNKRLANVKFKLTETTTGESHILVTDENGYVNTSSAWNKHSNNTNRGERSSDGVWFGTDQKGNTIPVNDALGALPYGTYVLEELRSAANKGYDLLDPITIKIDEDAQTLNLGNVENSYVELDTIALDKETKSHFSYADGETTIVDTVYFDGLSKGKTYRLVGTAIDLETKNVLTVDGKEIKQEKTFVANSKKSNVEMSFTFDGSNMAGKNIVIIEELYRDGILISSHTDLEDSDQMIKFALIDTSASDSKTGEKLIYANNKATISDKVTYKNLIPKSQYVLKGIAMDTQTGEPIKVNGKTVKAEVVFYAKNASGVETIEFSFNASELAGRTVTIYEELYTDEGKKIASHEVLNDPEQTVFFPGIHTIATDKITEAHVMNAGKDTTIVDTVNYNNLIAGEEYELEATLMDKATGEAVTENGEKCVVKKTFTADNKDGSTTIDIQFDSSGLEGSTFVVFEKLYYKGNLIAQHKDINDENQTVYVPVMRTTAIESTLNGKIALPTETANIKDTVAYENLPIGIECTVSGIAIDKATGNPILIDGKEVTATHTFISTKHNGNVELNFTFNSMELSGKTIVVYETLYFNQKEIASHKDINDVAQTIYYPYISTTAIESRFGDHIAIPSKDSVITDTVSYTNLPANEEFTLNGILMNRDTGEAVFIDGKNVTATKTFKTSSESGTQKLSFKFDATKLEGTTVVVYEELVYKGTVISTHKDIADAAQTIYYPHITTEATADALYNGHLAVPSKETTIKDKVSYTNLLIGKEYTVSGVVMDQETGKPIKVNGKEVRAEHTFTATEENGYIELEFMLDSSELAGKRLVVYEDLIYNEKVVVSHKDINDEAQTIYVPSIGTSAIDKVSNNKDTIVNESNVIVDTVSYSNLIIGAEYKLKGYLMNKQTNDYLLVDGKKVEAETTFIAKNTEGKIELEFIVPGNDAGGREIVVFEELYLEDVRIAWHNDISDEEQTVKYDYTSVMISKTDIQTEKPLAGAKLQLLERVIDTENSTDDSVIYKEVLVDEWTSTEEPHISENVKPGEYIIREVETPEGYVTSEDILFTKDNAYEKLEFTMKDDVIKVEISKKDATDQSELIGAKMQLLDADGTVVDEWTTDGKVHAIEYLPVGTYQLVEVEAPFGYALADAVTIEVEDTNAIQTFEMLDARVQGYIEIEKLSSVNRKALSDAVFELKDKDGNIIDTLTTDENGFAKSCLVDIGIYENGEFVEYAKYYLKETKAPEGYALSEQEYEISFEYLGDDVAVVYRSYKIPNTMLEVEKPEPIWKLVTTGDNSKLIVFAILLCASASLIIVNLKRKK